MSELSEAINEMRTMRESYDQVAQAAEAYNVGKTELAANITAKGVEASASETLPELAEKVSAIAQESYTIDGGEMYAKQLFGSLETPNYWNLYDILAQLLSDGRLVSYGGILLAEYYRGYDSLALSGAGAGGAYVVSDKDGDGNFKMYTEDTTHTWAKEFDGYGNRWVAYCFADEYHDFQITDTNTSPRSIFIGRKVGTINCLVNTRISQIVVPDGNSLQCFNSGGFLHNFSGHVVVKNIRNQNKLFSGVNQNNVESYYIESNELTGGVTILNGSTSVRQTTIIKVKGSISGNIGDNALIKNSSGSSVSRPILVISAEAINATIFNNNSSSPIADKIYILGLKYTSYISASRIAPCPYLYLGYSGDNKEIVSVSPGYGWALPDLELQEGWCKNLAVSYIIGGMTEETIYAHILQRLKQDEPNCGSGVTIALGSTNLEKLTSEESQALLAELRGTYGYTFA